MREAGKTAAAAPAAAAPADSAPSPAPEAAAAAPAPVGATAPSPTAAAAAAAEPATAPSPTAVAASPAAAAAAAGADTAAGGGLSVRDRIAARGATTTSPRGGDDAPAAVPGGAKRKFTVKPPDKCRACEQSVRARWCRCRCCGGGADMLNPPCVAAQLYPTDPRIDMDKNGAFHSTCFKCTACKRTLTVLTSTFAGGKLYCEVHALDAARGALRAARRRARGAAGLHPRADSAASPARVCVCVLARSWRGGVHGRWGARGARDGRGRAVVV
jgi:hypothetical protein